MQLLSAIPLPPQCLGICTNRSGQAKEHGSRSGLSDIAVVKVSEWVLSVDTEYSRHFHICTCSILYHCSHIVCCQSVVSCSVYNQVCVVERVSLQLV